MAIAALLLVAFALRLYLLDHQSLWSDEGNSVAMAPRAPLDIIQRTANDIHPPLYYLLLHYWSALVGTSVFAVRAFSVLCGVAVVALTYRLGRKIGLPERATGGAIVAIVAAGLLTISPFAIHYSQETRMYMLVAALGAGSWLAWLFWRKEKVDRAAIAYWFVTLALLYSHYYAGPLVIAQNLAWLITLREHGTSLSLRLRVWVVVQGTLVLAYLPWLWYARDTILNWPSISDPVTVDFMVREITRIFTLGQANEGLPLWVAIVTGVLLAAGFLGATRTHYGYVAIFYFIVPPGLMFFLSLDRPFWNPKFLLVSLPGYCLLLGLGVWQFLAWIPRWGKSPRIQSAGIAAVLGLFAYAVYPTLQNEYHDPRYARDDYKGMVRTILAQAGEDDAILLDGAGQREIFDYYYDGEMSVYGLPATQPLDVADTEATLWSIKEEHPQVWVLWWAEQQGDPDLLIPAWLDNNAFETGSRWFGNVRLERYILRDPPTLERLFASITETDAGMIYTGLVFGAPSKTFNIALTGMGIDPSTVVAGDVVALYTEWQPVFEHEENRPDTVFFAQLLDAENHVIGQYDGVGGAPSTTQWDGSAFSYRLRMGIPVPFGTPPGTYRLIVGGYDRQTGQRYSAYSVPQGVGQMEGDFLGDSFTVGTIQVTAPPVPPTIDAINLPNGQFMDVRFGPLALVAAQINRLGFDHAPNTPLRAGEPLSALLYWQIRGLRAELPALTLQLQDINGQSRIAWPLTPGNGTYPLDQWRVEDLIRDPHTYFLPLDLSPGSYELVVMNGHATQSIGNVTITP